MDSYFETYKALFLAMVKNIFGLALSKALQVAKMSRLSSHL